MALNVFARHDNVEAILRRADDGYRLDSAEALVLLKEAPLHELADVANRRTRSLKGQQATYIINRYINYTNYCILDCVFCSFARKRHQGNGFELSLEEIESKVRQALDWGIKEVHIVGGLHPSLPYEYYIQMIKRLRQLDHRLQLKCFTAIEVLHMSHLARKTPEQVLQDLRKAGLDMLTGGGAEIFAQEIRQKIAPHKETAEQWLSIHKQWHRLGGKSTCTMLLGHIESLADRIDHLARLRALQDETRGFVGFVPLPYHPGNNRLGIKHGPSAVDILRTIAVARLFLDNVPNITAYWVALGVKLAQVALFYGANDLHGTLEEEHIFHMAGASSPQRLTEEEMVRVIQQAGLQPVRRNAFYEPDIELEQHGHTHQVGK